MRKILASAATILVALAGSEARAGARVVGPASLVAYAGAVGEELNLDPEAPVVVIDTAVADDAARSFCRGVGDDQPNILIAARQMTQSEAELCAQNGVSDILEVIVGYDAVIIVAATSAAMSGLTATQVFEAFADKVPIGSRLVANPYIKWKDIDPTLPDARIEGLGPPAASARLQSFIDIALSKGAETSLQDLKTADAAAFATASRALRADGAWVDGGENQFAVVRTLEQSPGTIAVFDFAAWQRHAGAIKALTIDGVEPTMATITIGDYPLSQPLYVFAKSQNAADIKDFIAELVSEPASGGGGYLTQIGLVPLAPEQSTVMRQRTVTPSP